MIVYLVCFAVILLGGYFFKKKEKCSIYIILVSICMFLISALRSDIMGADTRSYIISFKSALRFGIDPEKFREIGYIYFEYLCTKFMKDPQVYLAFIALIVGVIVAVFIYKNSKWNMWSLLLYFSLFFAFYEMTGLRQTLAAMILIVSYEFVKKRKLIPFLICVVAAYFFHKSAIVFVVFYFIADKKIKIGYVCTILGIFVLFYILREQVLGIFTKWFVQFTGDEYYGAYANLPLISKNFTNILFLITCFAIYRKDKVLENNPTALHYYNALFLGLVIAPTGLLRIVQYFSIFLIFLLPEVLLTFEKKQRELISGFMSICLILLTIKTFVENITLYPYKFFWQ